MTALVRITWERPTASGRRTGWGKLVTGIDHNERGAQAFVGGCLQHDREADLPVGSLILEVAPEGPVKSGCEMARLYRLDADGVLALVVAGHDWRSQFLAFGGLVAKVLEKTRVRGTTPAPALADVSDEDLLAECQRRGIAPTQRGTDNGVQRG